MNEVNVDALAEQHYASKDPQFEPEEDPAAEFAEDLQKLLDMIEDADWFCKQMKDKHKKRKLNEIARRLEETADEVDKLIDKVA